jgi:hypothetical protein
VELTRWLFGRSSTRLADPRTCNRKQRLFSLACSRYIYQSIRRRFRQGERRWIERFAEDAPFAELFGKVEEYTAEIHGTLEKYAEGQLGRNAFPERINLLEFLYGPEVGLYPVVNPFDELNFADAALQAAVSDPPYPPEVVFQGMLAVRDGPDGWMTFIRLLHDIFGPLPFRDIAVDPSWCSSDVMLLARGIYEEQAFDRMPILADALQDAGCDNDDILNHCRAEKWEHVRGCWVIDLLLGRPWREPVV